MTREEAIKLFKTHVESEQLYRHCLAVEGSMISYAKKYGKDEHRWSLLGLLHDIDFEKHPEVHPAKAPEFLADAGMDQEFIDTILSHGLDSDVPRDTLERKCLHAVDQMSSFILAVALMRPTGLEGLKAKSVKKKMKTKAFAANVDRDRLVEAYESLGVDFEGHVDTIVEGLMVQEERLKAEGFSLLG